MRFVSKSSVGNVIIEYAIVASLLGIVAVSFMLSFPSTLGCAVDEAGLERRSRSPLTCDEPGSTSSSPRGIVIPDVVDASTNALVVSEDVTVSGVSGTVSIQVVGEGNPQISIANNSFVSSGSISSGQSFRVRLTSAPDPGQTRMATISVGGRNATFSVTTGAFTHLSLGASHSCTVMASGAARCFGANASGQLGNGSTSVSNVGVQVAGLSTGVSAAGAGGGSSCAVTNSGSTFCWGRNDRGQLGIGATGDLNTPQLVSGLSLASSVSVGDSHACGLTRAGSVLCWGSNDFGQLGNGTQVQSLSPVPVIGLDTDVVKIATGARHSCAVLRNGEARCWGDNAAGQLGNGSTANALVPVTVSGFGTGAREIAAGASHTCAIDSAGAVRCWGSNEVGQLGNGTNAQSGVPVSVPLLSTSVVGIAAGGDVSCAVTGSGDPFCWGANAHGQLGNGSSTASSQPVAVSGLQGVTVSIATGGSHSCARMSSGAIMCWGRNDTGALGSGNFSSSSVPVATFP